MNSRFLPALLFSILLLAGFTRLAAQPQTQYRYVDQMLSEREIAARRFFMNQAEKIYVDAAEREKQIVASIKASKYDVNHDGKLDATERAAWEKRLRIVLGMTPKFMRQYDVNRDNLLSDAEWEVAYLAIFEPATPAPAGNPG